jgi:hypothetical protein
MKKYLVQRDYEKYQPYGHAFQEYDKNGFFIEGDTPQGAISDWNNAQPQGLRLNPFYLKITEVTDDQILLYHITGHHLGKK